MEFVVWRNALTLWLVVISTGCATALWAKKCKKEADCKVTSQTCHPLLKICVTKNAGSVIVVRRKPNCKKCLADEYCHPIFKRCFKTLTPPSTRSYKKPTAANCKQDSDCTNKKYCHNTFKKCLDIPVIPTMSTTRKSSTQSCRNDSACVKNHYCHNFFKICLKRLTVLQNVTTPPTVKRNCTTDTECNPGQYCRNGTNSCEQVKNLSGSGMPSPPTKYGRCRTDSDCSDKEFCHRRISLERTRKNQRPRCKSRVRCSSSRKRNTGLGMCTTSMVALHPPIGNCSRDEDCGPGMCCLAKLGMCKAIPTRGDPCVTQPAYFTCPCSANLFCKANSKKRKLKGKRLERRLNLSTYIHRQLKKRGLAIHKKFMYGKCHQSPR